MIKTKLWYFVSNGGDGSVHVNFFKNEKDANDAEEYEWSSSGEGWGEPSVGSVELDIDEYGNVLNPTFTEKDPNWLDEDEPDFNELVV